MIKVLLSGYFGFRNFGDEAILSVLVEHLKTLDCNITALSSNPEFTKDKDNIKAIKNFDLVNVIREIITSDVLISGGGSLLQDVTSLKSLIYYSLIIFIALFFKKKVIIFAQGIGPLNKKISQTIVKNLLKNCDFVSVRDENSQKLLEKWNIKSALVCDPIYSVQIPHVIKNNHVCVQLRSFTTITEKFLKNLADNILKNYGDRKIEILSLQDTLDLEICEHFKDILHSKSKSIVCNVLSELDNKNIIGKIASCDTLVSMRFHAILIGIKSNVKTMAINYDIKVKKIAEEFGLPVLELLNDTDFEYEFEKLKKLDTLKLLKLSDLKIFDWKNFDEIMIQ